MCLCERVRERERECVCVCVRERESVCVYVCVREEMCVCECVSERFFRVHGVGFTVGAGSPGESLGTDTPLRRGLIF